MVKLNSCFIITLFASIFLFSCSDDPVTPTIDTSTFVYPFTLGSSWNYNRTFSVENIRPDSIQHYFSEFPFYASGNITISHDTLLNGIPARVFVENYTEVQQNDTMVFQLRLYYGNYDTALVCYARRGYAGSWMPYRPANQNVKFSKYGMSFNSLSELLNAIEAKGYSQVSADSLYMEIPPSIIMKYPIVAGTEWVAKYFSGVPLSTKKYISFNIENINNMNITCIKTLRTYSQFPEAVCNDYYSKFGQVKKDFLTKDVAVTDSLSNIIGYVDYRDLYVVTSFNIITP